MFSQSYCLGRSGASSLEQPTVTAENETNQHTELDTPLAQ